MPDPHVLVALARLNAEDYVHFIKKFTADLFFQLSTCLPFQRVAEIQYDGAPPSTINPCCRCYLAQGKEPRTPFLGREYLGILSLFTVVKHTTLLPL